MEQHQSKVAAVESASDDSKDSARSRWNDAIGTYLAAQAVVDRAASSDLADPQLGALFPAVQIILAKLGEELDALEKAIIAEHKTQGRGQQ